MSTRDIDIYTHYNDKGHYKTSAMQMRSENEKNLSAKAVRLDLIQSFQMHGQHEHGRKVQALELNKHSGIRQTH